MEWRFDIRVYIVPEFLHVHTAPAFSTSCFFVPAKKMEFPSHVLGEIDIQHLPYGDGLHHLFLVSHCGWFIVGERSIKKPMQILTSWISWHDVLMVTCLLRNGIAKAPLL